MDSRHILLDLGVSTQLFSLPTYSLSLSGVPASMLAGLPLSLSSAPNLDLTITEKDKYGERKIKTERDNKVGEFDSCQYWRNDQVLVQEQIEQYLERVLMCKYFANLRILLTLRTYSKHLEKKKWSMIDIQLFF